MARWICHGGHCIIGDYVILAFSWVKCLIVLVYCFNRVNCLVRPASNHLQLLTSLLGGFADRLLLIKSDRLLEKGVLVLSHLGLQGPNRRAESQPAWFRQEHSSWQSHATQSRTHLYFRLPFVTDGWNDSVRKLPVCGVRNIHHIWLTHPKYG